MQKKSLVSKQGPQEFMQHQTPALEISHNYIPDFHSKHILNIHPAQFCTFSLHFLHIFVDNFGCLNALPINNGQGMYIFEISF